MTLTREEILQEPPGIRLDQWVSKYVMGYETRRYYRSDDPQSYDEFYIVDNKKYENVYYTSEWQPSKYIDAAWIVVEKMRQTHWIDISGGLKLHLVSPYTCQIGAYGVPGSLYADGETAPEAICKAALLVSLNL